MLIKSPVSALMAFAVLTLSSCFTIRNLEQVGQPLFLFNDSLNNSHHVQTRENDSLTVISFNIEKADKIQKAIEELESFNDSIPVDIFLLQEMNEESVKTIAEKLRLNYLYIPIAYNTLQKQNVGNAILARAKINSPQKLILPNKKGINGRRRHATAGEIIIGNEKFLVYSVHTETSSMKRAKRMEQFDAILEHAHAQSGVYDKILIGGDFNTLYSKDTTMLIQKFRDAGYSCATTNSGFTAKAFFGLIRPRVDYIFFKGLQLLQDGKIEDSKSSDHFPVYTIFRNSN